MVKYGTYLDHLVKETIKDQDAALSVKEIALLLAPDELDKRAFINLRERIRRAAESLVFTGIFLKEKERTGHNLFCWKYSIKTEENLDL